MRAAGRRNGAGGSQAGGIEGGDNGRVRVCVCGAEAEKEKMLVADWPADRTRSSVCRSSTSRRTRTIPTSAPTVPASAGAGACGAPLFSQSRTADDGIGGSCDGGMRKAVAAAAAAGHPRRAAADTSQCRVRWESPPSPQLSPLPPPLPPPPLLLPVFSSHGLCCGKEKSFIFPRMRFLKYPLSGE